MSEKEYDYLKDTILVTYPDGPETYGATQAAPSSGMDTSDATATADDIRVDKTAYVANGKIAGTIEDYDGSSEPASGKSLFAQLVDKSITEVSASDLAGISKIGENAFQYCHNLTSITISDTATGISDYAFSNCSKLTSVTIPNNAMFIGGSVFYYCRSLTSVIIGNGITRIGSNTFYNCGTTTESGTIYTVLATTPPTIQSSTFQNAKINKIIVPVGTANTYKAATNWSALADYIEEATV